MLPLRSTAPIAAHMIASLGIRKRALNWVTSLLPLHTALLGC